MERVSTDRSRSRSNRTRKIPFHPQRSETDSAAACLVMVLGSFGRVVPFESISSLLAADVETPSPVELMRVARQFSLVGRGLRVAVGELGLLPTASILHWDCSRYVVFEAAHADGATILDPRTGRRRIGATELNDSFTGVAIEFDSIGQPPAQQLLERGSGDAVRELAASILASRVVVRLIVLSFLLQMLALAFPTAFGFIVDEVIPSGDRSLLFYVCGIGVLAGAMQYLASVMRADLLTALRTRVHWRLGGRLFEFLTRRSLRYFGSRDAADIAKRMNGVAEIREMLSAAALASVLDAGTALLVLGLITAITPIFGVTVLAVAAIRGTVFLATRRRTRDNMMNVLVAQTTFEAFQLQAIIGMESVKALRAEPLISRRWGGLLTPALNRAIERAAMNARIEALDASVAYGAPFVLLGVLAFQVQDGRLGLGIVLALYAMGALVTTAITTVVTTGYRLRDLTSHLTRMDDILDAGSDPYDEEPLSVDSQEVFQSMGVNDLVFRYDSDPRSVCNHLSLRIESGQVLALVGRSGCGKSTLLRVMAGLRSATFGEVMITSDRRAYTLPHEIRAWVTLVPQSPYIFGGTLRENLMLASVEATTSEMESALKDVGLWKELRGARHPLDLVITEGGRSLSGGQRQRVAIARALLSRTHLLCLDEATSALDRPLEERIMSMLDERGITRVVVTHRLQTVMGATRILVLEHGEIAESGCHEELLELQGTYARMVRSTRDGVRPRSAEHELDFEQDGAKAREN